MDALVEGSRYFVREAVAALKQPLDSGISQPRAADPKEIAAQFEAIFWRLVLGELREAFSEEGLFPSDPADGYGAMFDLFLGDYLARSRSLGVARMVETYLTRLKEASSTGAPEGEPDPR